MTSTHPLEPDTLLRHAGFVRAVACAAIRGDADVDDVVQDTWLALLEGGPRRPGPIRPWLAKVARRRAADVHRKRVRVRRREAVAARPEAVASTVDLAARAELGRRVVDAVLALKDPYRDALLLRYYDDLPPRDVARRMGTPVETARTRVRRGLEQLRSRFDREHGGDRRVWMTALLPLVPKASAAPASGLVLGIGLGKALLLAAAVVVGIVLVWRAASDDEAPVLDHVAEVATAPPTLRGRALPAAEEATAPTHVGAIRGRVMLEGKPQACPVELRAVRMDRASRPVMWFGPRWMYDELVGGGDALARVSSDAEGRFVFDRVAAGTYEVRALGAGRRVATQAVHLRGRALGPPLVLELPGGPVLLSGKAVHADGRSFRGWIRVHVATTCTVTLGIFGVEMFDGQGLVPVDDDGRFTVRGVPSTTVRLAAMRPGAVRYLSEPVTLPYATPYTFVVDEGMGEVRGRVLAHEDGRPIAGAQVEALARSHAGARVNAGTTTDGDGRFRLVIPDEGLSLSVSAPGRVAARRGARVSDGMELHSYGYFVGSMGVDTYPLERGAGDEVVVRLLRAPRVTGTVVNAATGDPVPGVCVMGVATSFANTGASGTTYADATGRYALEGLPPGACAVFAAGGGWMSEGLAFVPDRSVHNPFVRELEAGEEVELDLKVVRAVSVSGRVLDPAGTGIAGAAVRAAPYGAFPPLPVGSPQWLATVVTDVEGRFTLDTLLPGFRYTLYAEAPGHPLASTERIEVGPEGRADLAIEMAAPHWLVARVVDGASGAPIPGVRITARIKGHVSLTAWWTATDGRVLVGPLPPGTPRLVLRVPGYRRLDPVEASTALEPARAPEVVIRLAQGGTLEGVVTGPPGIPLGSTEVTLRRPRGPGRRRRVRKNVRADAAGRFRFHGLEDGHYDLEARLDHDGRVFEATAEATPGGDALSVPLLERPGGTRWELTVRDAGGRIVHTASADVTVRRPDGDDDGGRATVRQGRAVLRIEEPFVEAWLDVTGARDEAAAPLSAGAILGHPLPLAGGPVEVLLPAPRRITGVVKAPDGTGVSGASVFARPPGAGPPRNRPEQGAHATGRTDEDGRFSIERLGDAVYTLVFRVPPAYLPLAPLEVRAGGPEVVVEPALAACPRVRVIDVDGAAVGGARVAARPAKPARSTLPLGHEVRTDARGWARLAGLVPGDLYRLEIDPPADRTDLAKHRADGWRPDDHDVVLAAAGPVGGHIRDAAGDPIPYARLVWRVADGTWTTERVGDDGAFRLENLPLRADVELFVRTGFDGGAPPPSSSIRRVRAGEENLVLTARPSARVELRVKGELGGGSEVMASLLPHGGHPMMTSRNANGVFEWTQASPVHRFTLFVVNPATGRYGLLEDVDPLAGPHVVTLELGEAVNGRVRVPEGAGTVHVWAKRDGLSVAGIVNEDGTFVVRGLFPGTWTLRASTRVAGKHLTAEASAAPGETVTLAIE